ncbi:uncharacterized protein LOC135848744 [Planococcus citri]|uniref:uncharacterized protein LOC135848744 n=1 Tax=Planococcus citri TaxID=170843 RepID=UPI0031F830AC
MSKPQPDPVVHWICGSPFLAIDEKMKLNLNEFYKSGLNASEGGNASECESCLEDGRRTLEFEKKGPYPFRLYTPPENEPKCLAIDVLFKDSVVSVAEIKFQNYYTAYVTVLMKLENSRGWRTMIDHHQLMPYPHFETGSRSYFKFCPTSPDQEPWSNVTEIRFVLRQPSPNWKRFCIENLRIYKDTGRRGDLAGEEAATTSLDKNYLTGLIRKTTEALKMEHKNDKNSSTIPFHIGTYGYEIDKLIRF